ncbi:MAG TPA: alpha-1,4-glucan--maltose-1-phosphate maltosyltransferase, partial [Chthoniobacteraceae bacterium]|nr:alpha-1,4-glucan--maltose-1-phosphate maltosyltransferase [Chthoniobacteraceae bacterium]
MMSLRPATVIIENVAPLIDHGRFPIKRGVGENLVVEADIFKDGHDIVRALLKWRPVGAMRWHETPMVPIVNGNDRWRGTCALFENSRYELTIEAWGDTFASWQHEFHTKVKAGLTDLASETLEGAALVAAAAARAQAAREKRDAERLNKFAAQLRTSDPARTDELAHRSELEALMSAYADRSESTEFALNPLSTPEILAAPPPISPKAKAIARGAKKKIAPCATTQIGQGSASARHSYPQIIVDRERATFSQWYEFFPRSAEGRGDKGSTFRDCLGRIDDARAMGFNIIYFPPIHPIGITARKGRNNAVTAEPGEPGVPYAIGNRFQNCPNGGGHKDVAPELGTLEDFDWLVGETKERGLELALDFALNCSPDHPYVHEHPEWFYKRPDGTIKYAENPPKKYQDVYPLNFHNSDWRALWDELVSVIEFWCEHEVRVFRVDNPHTKPVAFWEYLIARVQSRFPDTIFLSEAFTRPKMMKALAKAGFTHSYTYFTWRNTKQELTEYFVELTQTEMRDYFRANLWPNTPDILPFFLQHGGRPAFMIRSALAATLSPIYGIYSGFELCENAALPNREEYLDSEKYQWKERDWNAPGNIKSFITRLNRIRQENRALQQYDNLRFYPAENENVLFYGKMTEARDNLILVIVNLDPWQSHDAFIEVPVEEFGWL